MRKIKFFIAAAIMVLLFGQNVNAQAVTTLKCGGSSVERTYNTQGVTVNAANAAEAKQKLAKIVLLNATNLPKCSVCPKPNGKECELALDSWVDEPTGSAGSTPGTWVFPPQALKFKVKCLSCDMTMVAATITDPVDGTLAICGGSPQYVTLEIPGVNIFNLNGDMMTMAEAQFRWRNMIIMDNGTYIEGSAPWGCMVSTCGDLGGCNMSILPDSDPIPSAEMSEENPGVWHFEPTTYSLLYSCSACNTDGDGDDTAEDDDNGDDSDNGLGKNGRVKAYNMVGQHESEVVQQLYPNPANDDLNIILNAADEQVSFTITDITGKLIQSQNVIAATGQKTLVTLDLSDYAPGIYHLSVKTGTQQSYREFIVK